MRRLFAFGCSYTSHMWPMWPAFFNNNFDEVLNFGRGGAGNSYIFHTILEGTESCNITPDDVVVVMWSTYVRRDLMRNDFSWDLRGGVANYLTPDQLDLVWTMPDSVVKSWDYIYATSELLKSKNIKFAFTSIESLKSDAIPVYTKSLINSDIFCEDNLTSYTYKNFPKYLKTPWLTNHQGTVVPDPHPKINASYQFAKDIIGKKIGIDIGILNDEKVKELHNILDNKIIEYSKIKNLSIENVVSKGSSQMQIIKQDYLDKWIECAKNCADIK